MTHREGAASMKIIGHRGARGLAAENTLAGIAKAVALGVDGVEIDVHLIQDGYFALHHNFLFSSQGPPIKDMSQEDLRAPPANGAAEIRVPMLYEALEILRAAHDVSLYVEVKTDPTRPDLSSAPEDVVPALLTKLETHLMVDRVTVLAFDWRLLSILHARAPNVKRGFLTEEKTCFADSPWLDGHDDTHLDAAVQKAGGTLWLPQYEQLNEQYVTSAHAKGLEVIPWTVNDIQDAQRLQDWGVDGLITDYPDRFVERFCQLCLVSQT
ncbi:MAG: hypothetical protein C0514_02890 [Candidatus Puniceispirillum sp.]|nr:hypothetical protein [Candidatus Puniceispirillum sp.]